MDKITSLPDEIETNLKDTLVALVLAGRHHPEGLLLLEKEVMVHPNDMNGNPSRMVQEFQKLGLKPKHWPTLGLDTKYIYDLQSYGYALVIHDKEKKEDRLRLTDQGYDLYKKIVNVIGKNLLG